MKKTTQLLPLVASSFIFLTGFHSCHSLTPEEKAARLERYSTAMVEDAMDDVDANQEQRAQAQAIRRRVVLAATPQIAEQEKAKQIAFEQWASSQPDREQIHALVDQRVDSFRKVLHLAADGVLELHQVLTPEQRKQIAEEWKE